MCACTAICNPGSFVAANPLPAESGRCESSHAPSHWAGPIWASLCSPCLLRYKLLQTGFQHATAIPSRTYPFSSDQGSQTGLGSTSTRLSDRPGTLSAVVSFAHRLPPSMQRPVLLPILLLLGCNSSAANTQATWPHLHCVCGCVCRLLATSLPSPGLAGMPPT